MEQKHQAAFTITSLENHTDKEFSLAIKSIGSSSHPVNLFLTIPAHQKVAALQLSFGPQEHYEHQPPKGYLITNTHGTEPFKTLKAQFEYKENPLIDILYEYNHRSLNLPYLYYWALYCNNKQVQLFQTQEHERKSYSLVIGSLSLVQIKENE